MSSTLYWEPNKRSKTPCSPLIKEIFKKRFEVPITLCANDIPYLYGLQDAGVDGIGEMIDVIDECGSIDLTEEY